MTACLRQAVLFLTLQPLSILELYQGFRRHAALHLIFPCPVPNRFTRLAMLKIAASDWEWPTVRPQPACTQLRQLRYSFFQIFGGRPGGAFSGSNLVGASCAEAQSKPEFSDTFAVFSLAAEGHLLHQPRYFDAWPARHQRWTLDHEGEACQLLPNSHLCTE